MGMTTEEEKLLKIFERKPPQEGYGVLAPETVKDDEGKQWEVDRKNKQVIQRDAVGTSIKRVGKDPLTVLNTINDGYDPRAKATEAPQEEAPVEAPKPTGTRQYASPAVAQTTSTKERMTVPSYAPDSSVWERALIGATPLLVGLLSGNALEGAQVASQHVVADEGDRYKRGKDFNQKLAEMAAKREYSTKTDKINAKTFEYRGSDDVNRIGRFVNGQQLIDEANDPLSPVDAKKENYANFDYEDEQGTPRIGTRVNGKMVTSKNDPVKYVKPEYTYKEGLPPNSKDLSLLALKDGGLHAVVAKLPEGARKGGMSLEERMRLAKYNKDLKADDIKFTQERGLNKDFEGTKTTKDTRDIAAAHAKIMDTSFGKSPISDVATVIGLFKMMDPGSVVRESELALGLNARSWEDVANNLEDIVMKNGYLTPSQRDGVRRLADKMYRQQLKLQEETVNTPMRSRAKQYDLNPNNVVAPIKSAYVQPTHVNIIRKGKPYTVPRKHLEKLMKEDPSIKEVQ